MKLIKRALLWFLLVAALLAFAVPALAEADDGETARRVVKVAYPVQTNLTEIEGSGQYSGYSYEYLKKIAEFANWKLEYVTYSGKSLDDQILTGMQDVANGDADLIGTMLKSDALAKTYLYPQRNYGAVYTTLDALDTNLTLNETNYMEKKPLRIAILKTATTRNAEVESFVNNSGLSCTYVSCNSVEEQLAALESGAADVMVKVSLTFLPNLKEIAQFSPRPYYFISGPGNEALIAELDDAIDRINITDPYFESRLQTKYFENASSNFVLSTVESAYVEANPELQVLVLPRYAPFAFLDQKGNLCGISISILDEIGQKTGLHFNYHVVTDVDDRDALLASGEYSIILGPPHSGSFAENYGLVLSQPYLESGLTMFTNKNSEDKQKRDCVLALLKDITDPIEYDYKQLKYYDNIEDCLAAVNRGEADYGYVSQYVLDMYTTQNSHRNLNYMKLSGYSRQIGFYVPHSMDCAVLSIINKYIRSMPDKDVHSYLALALSKKDNSDILTIIQDNLLLAAGIVITILFLLLLSIVLAIYNRTNTRRNEKLKQAYAAKSDFLSRMSHDMRTPMNGIIGLTGLTLDLPGLPGEAEDNLQKIDESAKYLLSLINDTLDMNKIESNKIQLNPEPTNLKIYFSQMLSVIEVSARQKNVQLVARGKETDLPLVELDRVRVQQILFNVLSNAIKFTPENGTVSIDFDCDTVADDHVHTKITIRDTGIGMSKDFLPKIFEPFEQENTSATANYGGTGLGLAIVKNLVDIMGGTIWAASEKGRGTEFVITLDFAVSAVQAAQSVTLCDAMNALTGKRILLCEDHPLNAQIATRLLEKRGLLVEHAENGKLAVERFAQVAPDYYDAILMDIRMPQMDGLTAARAIRALPRADAKTVPIIAMTANAFDEDVQKSKAAGMNAHLAKPIEPNLLYQTLVDFLCAGK